MCKVSVLVPVYNVKTYLRECLDSLAAQTLQSIEFVCIDDGSTDGCSEILDAYAAKDARFRVIHKENSGYGASMNVGLRAARGTYIGIVESDDFADAEMFAALSREADANHADVVKSNFFSFTKREGDCFCELLKGCSYRKICSIKNTPKLLLTDTFVWTSVYRKMFLLENDIWFHETPGASYQDVAFSLKVAACCRRMYLLPEAYLHYRVDNMAASTHQTKKKIYCYHDEFEEYWKFLEKRNPEEKIWGAIAACNMWRHYRHTCFPHVTRMEVATYLHRVAREFHALEKAGELRADYWPLEEWQELCNLLQHPESQIFAYMQEKQLAELLKMGFMQMVKDATAIYLYGAGQVAQHLFDILDVYKIRVAGFLVDCPEENPASFADLPVASWKEASVDREHDLVVIAVTPRKPEVQQEIFFQLEQAGYRNVIVLTKELQDALA